MASQNSFCGFRNATNVQDNRKTISRYLIHRSVTQRSNCSLQNKGDFCLIGQSNLEFHWLIHWNLVNSFEAREDDCQLCDTSTVVFLFQVSCLLMRSWHGLNENCWFCEYFGYYLFFAEESFSPKRKSWGVIDNVQNVVSKKTTVFGATKRRRRTAKCPFMASSSL